MGAAELIPFELRAIDADGVAALIGLSPRTVLEKVACRPDFLSWNFVEKPALRKKPARNPQLEHAQDSAQQSAQT